MALVRSSMPFRAIGQWSSSRATAQHSSGVGYRRPRLPRDSGRQINFKLGSPDKPLAEKPGKSQRRWALHHRSDARCRWADSEPPGAGRRAQTGFTGQSKSAGDHAVPGDLEISAYIRGARILV